MYLAALTAFCNMQLQKQVEKLQNSVAGLAKFSPKLEKWQDFEGSGEILK